LVKEAKDKDEKRKATNLIEFVLKERVGNRAAAPTYKLKVIRFCKGTAVEWIDFHKELLRQNGINTQDRVANINTIMRSELLTSLKENLRTHYFNKQRQRN
jgi:hypothetical protein